MEKIVKIPEEFNHELSMVERLFLEVSGRENILNFMIQSNLKDSERYQEYWNEYIHYLKAYNDVKSNFADNVLSKLIDESYSNWQLNFDKKEVVFY